VDGGVGVLSNAWEQTLSSRLHATARAWPAPRAHPAASMMAMAGRRRGGWSPRPSTMTTAAPQSLVITRSGCRAPWRCPRVREAEILRWATCAGLGCLVVRARPHVAFADIDRRSITAWRSARHGPRRRSSLSARRGARAPCVATATLCSAPLAIVTSSTQNATQRLERHPTRPEVGEYSAWDPTPSEFLKQRGLRTSTPLARRTASDICLSTRSLLGQALDDELSPDLRGL